MLGKEDRKEVRGAAGYGARWLLAILAFVLILMGGLWALGVFSSEIKGKGEAFKTKNSSTNRIGAQEAFEDRYADITAAGQRITTMENALKRSPGSEVAQVNLTGSVLYCQTAVAQYNADARKYTRSEFRSADLPASLDASTTCQETT